MKKFYVISLIVAVSLTAVVLILRFSTGYGESITTSYFGMTGLKNGIGIESGETADGIFVVIPDGYTAEDLISVSSDTDVAYLNVNKDNIFGDGTVMAELVGVSEGIAEVCLRIDDIFTEKYLVNVVGAGSENALSGTDLSESDVDGVYITATGTKYHLKRSCAGNGATEAKLDYAVNGGYLPCKVCAMVQVKK